MKLQGKPAYVSRNTAKKIEQKKPNTIQTFICFHSSTQMSLKIAYYQHLWHYADYLNTKVIIMKLFKKTLATRLIDNERIITNKLVTDDTYPKSEHVQKFISFSTRNSPSPTTVSQVDELSPAMSK